MNFILLFSYTGIDIGIWFSLRKKQKHIVHFSKKLQVDISNDEYYLLSGLLFYGCISSM